MIFRLAAIVLFILAAIAFWFIDAWQVTTDLGFVAAGLACLAAEPFDTVVRSRI
jgi:glucan phosphoethanolaminetransferase (alkaline phosphatase superfamily)